MSAEVLYKKMFSYRVKVVEYWVVYCISVVMNFISEADVVKDSSQFWCRMTDLSNPATFILVVVTGFALVFYILLYLLYRYSLKQKFSVKFSNIMRNHSDLSVLPNLDGGVFWGKDRTLWIASPLILGLKPENVIVDKYDGDSFYFSDDKFAKSFSEFESGNYMKGVRKMQNDLPRYMLERFNSNFNKNTPLLSINLKQTRWAYCQYVWNRYRGQENAAEKNIQWHNQIISEYFDNGLKIAKYPNSFCLHLVIETADGKVLITEISQEKSNDYPKTKAVSIGEQLELADFLTPRDFCDNFVGVWAMRAVCEEFGLSTTDRKSVV